MKGTRTAGTWWLQALDRARLAVLTMMLAGVTPAFASDPPFPRPPELERDVQFWIRVYTEITTNAGFLHDERNLAVVYEKLEFPPDMSPRERQAQVDRARDRIADALRRIASGASPLSAEERRIRDLWGEEGTPGRLREATNGIRFQLGQANRFREGLVRSGAWEAHIAQTLANLGLPPELAVLPHVESSFNPYAYSKVGAAGLWQFMRSTGRRYLRIDGDVDDRFDPFRSTEAAAQLLAYNYRLLGTWPLALTAYNHGAAGMRRAKEVMGTDDIVKIVRNYKSRTFGFASRNFYVSFLAALEIDRNPEKYFGPIERAREQQFVEVPLPAYVPVAALERAVGVERSLLKELNPALRPAIWAGERYVPKGYRLRLPATGERWTPELLAQRLAPSELYASQPTPRVHVVARGDTLSGIAARYGVSVAKLAELNDLRVNGILRVGQQIRLPGAPTGAAVVASTAEPPARVTPASAVTTAPAAEAVSQSKERVYIVRRGDSLSEIARKVGVSEAELLRINRIRNPNFIYEGQRLLLAEGASTEGAPAPAVAGGASRTVIASAAKEEPAGAVPPAVAQQESVEDEVAVASVAKPAAAAEPVTEAQAEALSPALGPAVETPQTADPFDYSVASDDTIVVAAAETLGHFADWLGTSASRLRKLNDMKPGRPVYIGQRIKLEFRRVSRETFEERRRDYHRTLQAAYFAAHRIVGTEVYIARRGDSLWTVTQRYASLPIWLLHQYNPDVDLNALRPGMQLVIPRVEEVVSAGG